MTVTAAALTAAAATGSYPWVGDGATVVRLAHEYLTTQAAAPESLPGLARG
jgi:hypothetical protein